MGRPGRLGFLLTEPRRDRDPEGVVGHVGGEPGFAEDRAVAVLLELSPDKRARLGLFLAFQYPTAIPGLSVASFLRAALNAKLQGVDKTGDVDPTDPTRGGISMLEFRRKLREKF
ncbi:MAG TPA: hypothetical protein VNO86_11965, partial [Candidatus Binatia bacterium]|nr:hypothetical protein [Candidatus Binatia bacterium]